MSRLSIATLGGGGGHIPLIRRRWTQHAITAVVALGVAQQIGLLKRVPPQLAVAVLPAVIVIYLFVRDPKWPLVALIAATAFGLYRYGAQVGPVTVRPTDVPYLFLTPWALLLHRRHGSWSRNLLGQQYIALFVAAVAFTLFVALVRYPDDAATLVVSFFRFFTTVLLVWIVPQVIRRHEDVLFVLRALALTVSAELLFSLARDPVQATTDRLRGLNGPNAEGLLAVVLIVLAVYAPAPKTRLAKAAMLIIGLPALVLSRSIGALTAMGVVVAFFGIKRWRHGGGEAARRSGLLRPARVIVLGAGLILLVSMIRPLDLPTSSYFKRSSAGSRLVAGAAGVRIFFTEPLFGVGWQRSSRPEVIASRPIVEALKRDFVGFPETFFPDAGVTTTTTVHNAYIQVLAETGLIGSFLLAVALLVVPRRGRQVINGLRGEEATTARALAIVGVACVVWLNDNPIYGSQPETVVLALMIGLLATMAAIQRRSPPAVEAAPAGAAAGAAV